MPIRITHGRITFLDEGQLQRTLFIIDQISTYLGVFHFLSASLDL